MDCFPALFWIMTCILKTACLGGRGSSTMDRVGAASHHSSVGRGPPIGQFGDVDELMESSERVMEAGWIGMDGTSRSPGHDHGAISLCSRWLCLRVIQFVVLKCVLDVSFILFFFTRCFLI